MSYSFLIGMILWNQLRLWLVVYWQGSLLILLTWNDCFSWPSIKVFSSKNILLNLSLPSSNINDNNTYQKLAQNEKMIGSEYIFEVLQ